jgi:hypothetical protein
MDTFDKDFALLAANADKLVADAKATMRTEFADIDRALLRTGVNGSGKQRPNKVVLGAPTVHDLAANNPLLRKLLRDLQKGI